MKKLMKLKYFERQNDKILFTGLPQTQTSLAIIVFGKLVWYQTNTFFIYYKLNLTLCYHLIYNNFIVLKLY